MAVKLLCLCLLLALLCPSSARDKTICESQSNCDECIQAGPECAWCAAPRWDARCRSLKELRSAGCPKGDIYNPQSAVQAIKNDSSTETAGATAPFLQPQQLSLSLRPGVSVSFPLTVTMPTDQPVPGLTLDTSDVPTGVNITFSSVKAGNPQVVQVNVEAAQCPSKSDGSNQERTGPWPLLITPRGFLLNVKLEITLECQCDCTRDREDNSSACSGHGALVCGQCECSEPYIGQRCQSDPFSSMNDDRCRPSPNSPVCSGRGLCVDGFCECGTRADPTERYTGRFCECSDFYCPRLNNRVCGGKGRCECGHCVCHDGWTGEGCECSLEVASCMATNGQLCNGRGMCDCGACKCWPPYTGQTCEVCPDC